MTECSSPNTKARLEQICTLYPCGADIISLRTCRLKKIGKLKKETSKQIIMALDVCHANSQNPILRMRTLSQATRFSISKQVEPVLTKNLNTESLKQRSKFPVTLNTKSSYIFVI